MRYASSGMMPSMLTSPIPACGCQQDPITKLLRLGISEPMRAKQFYVVANVKARLQAPGLLSATCASGRDEAGCADGRPQSHHDDTRFPDS